MSKRLPSTRGADIEAEDEHPQKRSSVADDDEVGNNTKCLVHLLIVSLFIIIVVYNDNFLSL